MNKNCGIYKITSPTGRIYIGQSKDIQGRRGQYTRIKYCSAQPRIYKSLKKYGFEAHQFDIIEYCSEEELNTSERFWQDEFDAIGKNGLNCILTGTSDKTGEFYEGMKKAMSKPRKEDMVTTGRPVVCTLTDQEWRSLALCARKNNISRTILYNRLSGKVRNDTYYIFKDQLQLKDTLVNQTPKNMKGENNPMFGKSGLNSPIARQVICTLTGKVWDSITACAKDNNINHRTLNAWLIGYSRNKSTFKFLTDV